MKKYTLLACMLWGTGIFGTLMAQQTTPLNYPKTAKVDQKDDYFGTIVADPYRWLEVSDSSAVADWVTAQNEVTFGYLEQIPFRQALRDRLEQVWNYERYSAPYRRGEYLYFYKNDGLQNQSVLYRQKGDNGTPEVFFDPNKLSTDGTSSLGGTSFSKDNRYFAYSVSKGGSDWREVYIIDTQTGKKLADHIQWSKFSGISWYKDGFFYSRYDAPAEGKLLEAKNEYHKVYYHRLGEAQSEDQLIFENRDKPLRNFGAGVSEDERFLFIYASEGTSGREIYVKDLSKGSQEQQEWTTLVSGFNTETGIVGTIGDKILLLTNYKAPKYRLVATDLSKTSADAWETIIPETAQVLDGVSHVGGRLIASYLKDASTQVVVFDEKGQKLHEVKLPAIGTAGGFGGRQEDKEVFYTFTSFTYPPTIYRYDIERNVSTLYRQTKLDFNPEDYETTETFYKSKDGTPVHLFIVHKKGLKRNGQNPTYLYGYGGFNISLTPSFNTALIPFLESGGIYALANLRGGAEYGEEWHKGGMLLNKQNVFDDFIAAGEYLISKKYTSSQHLAIAGGSNGGLLVGACMTQRPDLFKVALPAVGVLDMLRFHKFTIGWAWVVEYGSSERSKEEFANLYRYSPLHNLKPGVQYPATLIKTADHDDRVVPAHSFKFAATLQEAHKGANPVLIRIDAKAGHGAGKPTSKILDEWADTWAFVFYNMGITPRIKQ